MAVIAKVKVIRQPKTQGAVIPVNITLVDIGLFEWIRAKLKDDIEQQGRQSQAAKIAEALKCASIVMAGDVYLYYKRAELNYLGLADYGDPAPALTPHDYGTILVPELAWKSGCRRWKWSSVQYPQDDINLRFRCDEEHSGHSNVWVQTVPEDVDPDDLGHQIFEHDRITCT